MVKREEILKTQELRENAMVVKEEVKRSDLEFFCHPLNIYWLFAYASFYYHCKDSKNSPKDGIDLQTGQDIFSLQSASLLLVFFVIL